MGYETDSQQELSKVLNGARDEILKFQEDVSKKTKEQNEESKEEE